MQDNYVGNIGDYIKYALLRAITQAEPKKKLGVAWYLHPGDGEAKSGGRHTDYFDTHSKLRELDKDLFDEMRNLICVKKTRSVASIETSNLLGKTTKFSNALLKNPKTLNTNKVFRKNWFENVKTELKDCDIVFADPDSGLYEDEKYKWGQQECWKRLPFSEAKALAEGRIAVFYHHNSRFEGGHEEEIICWLKKLKQISQTGECRALYWRHISPRTFFIINSSPPIDEALKRLKDSNIMASDKKNGIELYEV